MESSGVGDSRAAPPPPRSLDEGLGRPHDLTECLLSSPKPWAWLLGAPAPGAAGREGELSLAPHPAQGPRALGVRGGAPGWSPCFLLGTV